MQTFLIWDFKKKKKNAVIFELKNPTLLDIQAQCICKLGKMRSDLNLLFGVCYWFLTLYPGII